MANEQAVSEIVIRAKSEGIAAVARDLDKLVGSEEAAVRATEQANRVRESSANALDRLARRYDTTYKISQEVERAERAIQRAREAGLGATNAYERAVAGLAKRQEELSKLTNDNTKATGLARHELINLGRQAQDVAVSLAGGQSPFTVLAQQGSQVFDVLSTHKGGVSAALRSLGDNLLGLITPARLMGAGVVGSIVGIELAASKAQSSLSALGAQSARSGLSASTIMRARTVGAGRGLETSETDSALGAASAQFESFKRNSGDVLDFLKKFDASALPAIDKAKSLQEFIGLVGQEAKKLGGEQGLDLTQRLLGQDAGRSLVGEVDKLVDGVSSLSAPIDKAASAAYELQKQVAEAGRVADDKMLAAFSDLKTVSSDIAFAWISVKSAIADAAASAGRTYNYMRSWIPDWTSPTGFLGGNEANRITLPDINVGGSAGASRRLYPESGRSRGGGRSATDDAKREAERYEKIVTDLQQQIRLVSAIGEEHKRVQFEIEKENVLEKLGNDHNSEHRKRVGALAEELRKAREEQDKLTKATEATNEAYGAISQTLAGGIKSVIHGGKLKDSLQTALNSFGDNALDAALTGSGPFAKILNLQGKDGGVGGLFGGLASLFSPGGKTVGQMAVQATSVVVNGPLNGLGGSQGGLASWFESLFSGASMGRPTPVVGGAGPMAVPTFAGGGIMTDRGPLPLRAYAGGGIANSPQLALFGEGSSPEAYVPVPSGRIPVEMRGGGSHAAPVTVNLIGAPQGTQVKQETDSRGHRRIDIVMAEAVAGSMSNPSVRQSLRTSSSIIQR
ncbi:MAG: hypothetical protein EKK29_07060 [Hyphomicrobiales bacterium]|nr:MAG: hypothetical protein EKK29_07060 [Hyphomicrobiales bacterium]